MNKKKFKTKADLVYENLKTSIVNGQFKPGFELKISKISKDLNVSTIPVREALKNLASEGLIVLEPHKSAKVADFSMQELHQIITIRAGLEGYAARLAVDYIDDTQIKELEKMIIDMEESMENGDTESFNLYNIKFHRYLYQIAPFPLLYNMIIKVWDGGKWTRSIFAINPKIMVKSIQEHTAIVDAIKVKDRDRVERIVREHRINVGQELEYASESKKG